MLCTDASPVHPVLKDLLLGADVITPMVCTDASPVQPMLSRRLNRSLTALKPSADVITPMVCTDASPVQPVLKTWLLRDLHRLWNTVRPMHRCLS